MVRNLGELGINLQKIVKRLQANQRLLKLLYYTDKDPFNNPDLTDTQIVNEVYEKLIRVVPRVGATETANSIVAMTVMDGDLIAANDQFTSISIRLEVLVPLTQWMIKDSNLRPFAILSEIQKSLNGKVIDGIGKMNSGEFSLGFLTDEMSCYQIVYNIQIYD